MNRFSRLARCLPLRDFLRKLCIVGPISTSKSKHGSTQRSSPFQSPAGGKGVFEGTRKKEPYLRENGVWMFKRFADKPSDGSSLKWCRLWKPQSLRKLPFDACHSFIKLIIIAIRYERTLLLNVFPKAFVQPVEKRPSMGSCAPRCKRRINVEPFEPICATVSDGAPRPQEGSVFLRVYSEVVSMPPLVWLRAEFETRRVFCYTGD